MPLSTTDRQRLAGGFNAVRDWRRGDWLEEQLPDPQEASTFLWEAARHGDIKLEQYTRYLLGEHLSAMAAEDVQLMIDGVRDHDDASHPHLYDWDEPTIKAMEASADLDAAWLLDRWSSLKPPFESMAAFVLAMRGQLAKVPDSLIKALTKRWLESSSMYEAQRQWWDEVRDKVCPRARWLEGISAALDKDPHLYDWARILPDLHALGPSGLIRGALRFSGSHFRRATYDALLALGPEHIPALEEGLDKAYTSRSMFGQAAIVLPLVELYRQTGRDIPASVDAALSEDLKFYGDDDLDLSRQALAALGDSVRQAAIVDQSGTHPRAFLVLDIPQSEALVTSLVGRTENFDAKDKNRTGYAIRGLAACGELAVPPLVDALGRKQTKGALALVCTSALAKIKSSTPVAMDALVAGLGHSAKAVRTAADQGLADLGEAARPALEAGLEARKKAVREGCEAALARLGAGDAEETPLDEALSARAALDEGQVAELRTFFEENKAWQKREAAAATLVDKGIGAFVALSEWFGEKPDQYEHRGLFAGVIEHGFKADPLAAWVAVDVFARSPKISKYAVKEIVRALGLFGPLLRDPLVHALGSATEQAVFLYDLLQKCGADLKPARGVLIKGMQASSKTIREACLGGLQGIGPEVSADVLPLVASRKKDARLGAAQVLAKFPIPEAAEPLRKALDKEKSDEVATALELALAACGAGATSEPLDSSEDIDALLAGQRKARLPKFLDLDKLPEIRLADGTALSPEARRGLVTRLMKEGPEVEDALARQVRPHLDDADCAAWAVAIKDQWAKSGGNARHKWAVFQQAVMADEARLSVVGPRLDEMTSDGLHALAGWYLEVCARHGSNTGHSWIGYWDTHARRRGLKAKAKELLARLTEASGMDRAAFEATLNPFIADDVEDARIPRLDFDDKGQRALSYGARSFVLRIEPDLSVSVCDDAGQKIKGLPRIKASDDKAKAGDARAALSEAKQKLGRIAPLQKRRLEMAMIAGRSWDKAGFEALFTHHPIMGAVGQGLVFITSAGQTLTISAQRTLVDVSGAPVNLGESARVEVAHPTALSAEDRQSWADAIGVQPFEQLDREIFTPEDLGEELVFGRLSPRVFSKRIEEQGWLAHRPEDAGIIYGALFPLPARGIKASIHHEGYPVSFYGAWDDIAVESLSFADLGGEHLDHDEVHPAAFSEVVRALRWFGLSIDPSQG